MIPKLTGNLFRAGRALAGLTRDDLANRAGLSRDVLRSWEISSESIVPAQYQMLCRAIEALESEGVRFSEAGVYFTSTPVVCDYDISVPVIAYHDKRMGNKRSPCCCGFTGIIEGIDTDDIAWLQY